MRVADMSFGELIRAEARKQGRREGRKEGAQKVLLRLLKQRFGRLPASLRQRVEEIDSVDRLTRLAERVQTARSLEDLKLSPRRPDDA